MNTQIVKIDNKEYVLDIDRAKEKGVLTLKRPKIETFSIGDVFYFDGRSSMPIIILLSSYMYHRETYVLTGEDNGINPWVVCSSHVGRTSDSEHINGELTEEEVLYYLNHYKCVFAGNISESVKEIVKNLKPNT